MAKNNTKKKKKIYLSNVILFFPINKNNFVKKTIKNKKHLGGNNTSIDVKECMKQGFCAGDFPSTIPSNLQEYTVNEFSGNNDTNHTGDLHKIAELNSNLAVGDKNYTPATPPPKAVFLSK
jgi:hypothetical protein